MKRIFSAIFAAIFCLVLASGTGLAAAANPADVAVLTLTVSSDSAGQQVISGLTAAAVPLPSCQLTGLLRECTDPEAEFITDDPQTPAATGLAALWTSEGKTASAALVVGGDVLGSGVLNIAQLVRMAQALNGTRPLSGVFLAAADFNGGGLEITDLVHEAELLTQESAISEEAARTVVEAAVAIQTDGGTYSADVFHAVELHKGDIIYGMLPGQSAFYTDLSTVEACDGNYIAMYERLQMLPHPEYGYREQLGVYTVKEDTLAACGYCLANAAIDGIQAGAGGGVQFVIPDYEELLELTDTLDLHA